MENPNEYDDEKFLRAVHNLEFGSTLSDAVHELWEAGCTEEDIQQECERVIENTLLDLEA